MEFNFNINALLPQEICEVNSLLENCYKDKCVVKEKIQKVLECLGKRSAIAQKLPHSITDLYNALLNNHRIYLLKNIAKNDSKVLGFIKVGPKKLFLFDKAGRHHEMLPLCVLDFYVHEDFQRQGCGLKLFKFMLQAEHIEARHLAVDRPSNKFIAFLKKHFSLHSTIPQVNNFVIFDDFFTKRCKKQGDNTKSNQNIIDVRYQNFGSGWKNLSSMKNIKPMINLDRNLADIKPRRKRWSEGPIQNYTMPSVNKFTSNYSRYSYNRQKDKLHTEGHNPRSIPSFQTNVNHKENNQTIIPSEKKITRNHENTIATNFDYHVKKHKGEQHVESPFSQNKNDNASINSQERLITTNLFERIKSANYNKPSDMISELRQKDKMRHNNRHNKWLDRNTSFSNIFGVQSAFSPVN